MSSTVTLVLIVSLIVGSAGVMFLRRAFRTITQPSDNPNSGIVKAIRTFKIGVDLVVGMWFIIWVITALYLTFTRLL